MTDVHDRDDTAVISTATTAASWIMSLRVCPRPPKARILGRLASPRERDRGDTRYRWGSRPGRIAAVARTELGPALAEALQALEVDSTPASV